MYERVVVPLDGSPEAEEVFSYIRGMLTTLPMVFPTMIVEPAAIMSMGGYSVRNEDREIERLSDGLSYLRQAVSHGGWRGMRYHCVVRTHPGVAAGIVEVAVERGADLIALYSRSRTGIARLFTGSVARKLRRVSPIDVHVFTDDELALAS
jgi:nucleotide-binding universal stress UspA family protein